MECGTLSLATSLQAWPKNSMRETGDVERERKIHLLPAERWSSSRSKTPFADNKKEKTQ